MKKQGLLIILLCLCLAASFFACSKPAEQTAVTEPSTEATTTEVAAQIAPVASEEISFYDATDNNANILKLSPVYAKDGKNVVAAYIISATDKNKKALDAKAYPFLNCIVAASSSEKGIALTYNAEKKLVKIESYADKGGNLLAMQDINDINKNKNKTEFLKLAKKTNEKGSVHYLLTDEILEIKEENGKKVAIENGKKTEVEKVDSSNSKVKKTVEKQTASETEKKEIEEKQEAEDDKQEEQSEVQGDEKAFISIVLKKNGAAACADTSVQTNTNEVVINNPGDYKITSETDMWHGVIKLKLKNDEKAELRFEDVDISYNKGSIIQLIDESDTTDRSFLEAEATAGTVADDAIEVLAERTSAPNVDLTFPSGTKSTFTDSANVYTGVLYNEAKLTIKGNGKAEFIAQTNANNAISTSKSITIKNVNLKLETAASSVTSKLSGAKGIFSYSKVNIESGTLSIASNGDGIRCDTFYQEDGTVNISSSACDGIDADDCVEIDGGSLKVTALEKTGIKVRRVNNQDRLEAYIAAGTNVSNAYKKTCMRDGKDDGFEIDGGTVACESYKTSTPRDSDQKVIICKASKQIKGNDDESKKPVKWKISGVASSSSSSVKFLYSSSGVKQENYKVLADEKEKDTTWTWKDNVGVAKVISSTTV